MSLLWSLVIIPIPNREIKKHQVRGLHLLSRIAQWKHLEVHALRDSRIYTMEQSNSSTYEFRYLHRVIRVSNYYQRKALAFVVIILNPSSLGATSYYISLSRAPKSSLAKRAPCHPTHWKMSLQWSLVILPILLIKQPILHCTLDACFGYCAAGSYVHSVVNAVGDAAIDQ